MAFRIINFRQTPSYVTDQANATYATPVDTSPTQRPPSTGLIFQFSSGWDSRDRLDSHVDVSLAGMCFSSAPGQTFSAGLWNGPGTYDLQTAIGDQGGNGTWSCTIMDGATTLLTISGTCADDEFLDAAGNVRSAATWRASNTSVPLTFAGSTLTLVAGGTFRIASLGLQAAAPAGPDLTGTAALDGLSASGSLAPQPQSDLTGSATLDGLAAAGSMAMAPGTLTVPELRSWAGTLLTSQLVENIVVIRMADRTLLCAFTNQTTHGSTANLALSHAALAAGTLCMVVGYNPDGSARFARPVTVV